MAAVRAWRDGLPGKTHFEPLSGSPASLLEYLEPWAMPSWKQLVVATSGSWTALFSQGSDIYTFNVIGEALRRRSLRTNHSRHVVRDGAAVNYGNTSLWLFDSATASSGIASPWQPGGDADQRRHERMGGGTAHDDEQRMAGGPFLTSD